jgi:hypothetical protein
MLNLGTATLLVGFNRPELIEKRLAEISKFSNLKLYISIDGPRKKSNDAKANNEILKIIEKWKTKLDIVEIIHKKNIGLALNITSSIENVLESNESIFVIEDDVSVSKQAYNAILRMQKLAHSNVATIGGFGFTNGKFLNSKLSMKNAFRETPYFSAWGWCIDRNTFSNYVLDLSSIKIAKELRDSKIWNMLDAREREIWIRRFDRVLKDPFYTWDLQMQFMSFKYEKTHYLPLFRIIENEGFNDHRGTHIKGQKPKWYIGNSLSLDMSSKLYTKNHLINNMWIWADRYTWAGTRKIRKMVWSQNFKIRSSS